MTKIYFAALLIISVCLCPASQSFGQAIGAADSIKSMLIKDWERAKAYTQDYMKTMPAAKYSLKATDSVRSFAQQLLHISEATIFLVSTATGDKPLNTGADLEKRTSAQTADSVMYYVNMSYDFAINSIKKLNAPSLIQPVTINMGQSVTATRLGWLLKAFEHQTHHRGQTTVYLRLAGVRPPQERLF